MRRALCSILVSALFCPAVPARAGMIGAEETLFADVPAVTIASAKSENVEDAPANVYVITGEEMRRRGYRSVMDLFKDLPGVTWNNQVGNEKNGAPVIRGQSYQRRMQVLLNGMPLDERAGSGYGWDHRIPVEGVDRVEFINGPYASLYGRNSFSGVMNIVTKDGAAISGGSVDALYGEYARTQGTALYGRKQGPFDVYLSYFKNASRKGQNLVKDYPDTYGRAAREGKPDPITGNPITFSGSVHDKWYMPWDASEIYYRMKHDSGLGLDVEYNQALWAMEGTFLAPTFYVQGYHRDNMQKDVYGNYRVFYDLKRDGWSSFTSAHYQTWDVLDGRLDYIDGKQKYWQSNTDSYVFQQKFRTKAGERNEVYVGASYEDVWALGTVPGLRDFNAARPTITKDMYKGLYFLNLSLQDELKVTDRVRSVLGLMYEKSNAYDPIILPRASLMWAATDATNVKFLYGGGFITPDLITRADQIVGATGNVKGTTDIDPETLKSYELNVMHKLNGRTRVSASGYITQVDKVIALVADSSLPAGFTQTYKNLGEKQTRGGELNLDWGMTDAIKAFASYGYTDGFYKEADASGNLSKIKRLPMATTNHVKAGVNFRVMRDTLDFYVHGLHLGRIYAWTSQKLKGYDVVDLALTTTSSFHRDLSFSAGVNNVFDKKAFDAPYLDGILSPNVPVKRRHWTVQAGYKWGGRKTL
ncbi:MAG: TonB-dependent receptor [Elusimicrobia bacterium]|nr:TonB-dependent receptor [Elusimicrobiota bacterium]